MYVVNAKLALLGSCEIATTILLFLQAICALQGKEVRESQRSQEEQRIQELKGETKSVCVNTQKEIKEIMKRDMCILFVCYELLIINVQNIREPSFRLYLLHNLVPCCF